MEPRGTNQASPALALLAFAGQGNTHIEARNKATKKTVDAALRWLLKQQIQEHKNKKLIGMIGYPSEVDSEGYLEPEGWIYNHTIATLAIAEILIGSGDRALLAKPLKQAVDAILREQGEFGWHYMLDKPKCNTSSTLWAANALITARHCAQAGLLEFDTKKLDSALKKVHKWIEKVTGRNKIGYQFPGDPGSITRELEIDGKYPFTVLQTPANTAAGLFFFRFDRGRDADKSEALWEHLASRPPRWRTYTGEKNCTINYYYWYHGSQACYQHGEELWEAWDKALRDTLLPTQQKRGCAKGSWDPVGPWSSHAGRACSTALSVLALEATIRVQPLPPK